MTLAKLYGIPIRIQNNLSNEMFATKYKVKIMLQTNLTKAPQATHSQLATL